MSIQLSNGDCLVEMAKIPSGSVDMVMADLPYGTTGVACMNTCRSFIGIERDPEYFAIAQKRIGEADVLG